MRIRGKSKRYIIFELCSFSLIFLFLSKVYAKDLTTYGTVIKGAKPKPGVVLILSKVQKNNRCQVPIGRQAFVTPKGSQHPYVATVTEVSPMPDKANKKAVFYPYYLEIQLGSNQVPPALAIGQSVTITVKDKKKAHANKA